MHTYKNSRTLVLAVFAILAAMVFIDAAYAATFQHHHDRLRLTSKHHHWPSPSPSPTTSPTSTPTSATPTPTPTPTTTPVPSPTATATAPAPSPTATATATPTPPSTLGSCATSGATGAGNPTATVNVGAPVTNGGDSSTLIQNAINTASANGGGTVVLQAGTYWIDHTLTVKSNVDLTGDTEATTIVKAGATANVVPMITTGGNSNITVENMTVDQNGANGHSSQQWSTYMVEERNSVNVIFQMVATREPTTYAMVAAGGSRFCFRNNDVRADPDENSLNYVQNDGIHILNANTGDVRHNFVDNAYNGATTGDDGLVAHGYGGNVTNVTYEGNVVRGGTHGAAMGVWSASGGLIQNITVTGNEFWGGEGVHPGDATHLSNSQFVNNIFHNTSYAFQLAGTGLTVTGNYLCSAGAITVSSGNTVSGNPTYTGCTDAPSTTSPPPVYPPQ